MLRSSPKETSLNILIVSTLTLLFPFISKSVIFSAKELLGKQIATIHNLGFYIWLTNEARKRILDGTFYNWKEQMIKKLSIRL